MLFSCISVAHTKSGTSPDWEKFTEIAEKASDSIDKILCKGKSQSNTSFATDACKKISQFISEACSKYFKHVVLPWLNSVHDAYPKGSAIEPPSTFLTCSDPKSATKVKGIPVKVLDIFSVTVEAQLKLAEFLKEFSKLLCGTIDTHHSASLKDKFVKFSNSSMAKLNEHGIFPDEFDRAFTKVTNVLDTSLELKVSKEIKATMANMGDLLGNVPWTKVCFTLNLTFVLNITKVNL